MALPTRTTRRAAEVEAPVRRRRAVEEAPVRTRRAAPEPEAPVRKRRTAEVEAPTRRTRVASKPARVPRVNRFADVKPIREAFTRTSLIEHIAEECEIDKKIARDVIAALSAAIVGSIKPRSIGKFVLPGVLRVITTKKPAVKGGKKVNNPFKPGETMITKDRAARTVVKIRSTKDLKDAAMGL